jgi:SAM-dependent methyltransferase
LVLIIGGGVRGAGFHRLTGVQTVAFDIFPTEYTQLVADAHQVPLPNESVDAVWIQAVLEHVLEPESVVAEIVRVLKPGGVVYADTPFMQPVHEGAYDFTRYSHSGHRWLFRQFDEVGSGVSVGPGRAAVLSIRHAFTALFRSRKVGSLIALLLFWLRFIDNVTSARTQRDAAGGVWFLGRKATRSLRPQDMVKYYRA